jgi:hypothetical protein
LIVAPEVSFVEPMQASGFGSVVGGAMLVGACCAVRTGELSGRWVVVAGAPSCAAAPSTSANCPSGQAVGIAMPPSSGSPLQLKPASDCFDAKVLQAQFGDECKVNEAEAAGTSDMSGGMAIGKSVNVILDS